RPGDHPAAGVFSRPAYQPFDRAHFRTGLSRDALGARLFLLDALELAFAAGAIRSRTSSILGRCGSHGHQQSDQAEESCASQNGDFPARFRGRAGTRSPVLRTYHGHIERKAPLNCLKTSLLATVFRGGVSPCSTVVMETGNGQGLSAA